MLKTTIKLKTLVAILCLLAGCDSCKDGSHVDNNNTDVTLFDGGNGDTDDNSVNQCMQNCIDNLDDFYQNCREECSDKRHRLGKSAIDCDDTCQVALTQNRRIETAKCRFTCTSDSDGDGIPDAYDKCPNTKPDTPITWYGCADSDGDGIADLNDKCPNTPSNTVVGSSGCEIEIEQCEEGNCGSEPPLCTTEEECDRLLEQPLLRQVPRETLVNAVLRELSKQGHDIHCPDKHTPPTQPYLTSPPQGINPIAIDPVVVNYQNGQIVDGSTHPIHFAWEPVEDSCEPIRYSVLIEYYHCHRVGGLIEPSLYHNRGWCRWMPLTYESNLTNTSFDYEFDMGAHMARIHKAFEAELNWSLPADGPFRVIYQPTWLQARVIAHDGNGTSSSFGMHSDQRYIVFYHERTTQLWKLGQIPIGP